MNVTSRAAAAAVLVSTFGTAALAAPINLVMNGDFTASSYTANNQFGSGSGQGGQGVTGWTGNGGYELYFTSAAASSTQSAKGQYGYTGKEMLWGPVPASPTGGGFVALDGDPNLASSISQSISGLVVGDSYQLNFDWGAGQLQSRSGDITEALSVSLGGQVFSTPAVKDPSGKFTGWMHQAFTYTAVSAAETLTFLSQGTPVGLPPVGTVDGVSLIDVPEPASLALLACGMVGVYAVRRRRRA